MKWWSSLARIFYDGFQGNSYSKIDSELKSYYTVNVFYSLILIVRKRKKTVFPKKMANHDDDDRNTYSKIISFQAFGENPFD